MDFKTFFVFKGETTLRALVWSELWLIFFLVLVVTIWVFFVCICLWWHSFATEHITEVSSPSVTYERNVLENLSALL